MYKKFVKKYNKLCAVLIVLLLFFSSFGICAKIASKAEQETAAPIMVKEAESKTAPEIADLQVDEQPQYISLGEFRITAYCACESCCGYWATVRPLDESGQPIIYTASGTVAEVGRTVAVDTSIIPYGTKIIINGHTYIAEDCGGAINENRIDIYCDSHEAAEQFAVQYAEVFLIKE